MPPILRTKVGDARNCLEEAKVDEGSQEDDDYRRYATIKQAFPSLFPNKFLPPFFFESFAHVKWVLSLAQNKLPLW